MITEFSNGLPQGSRPGAIVTGPDGDLWFAEQGAMAGIGKLDPATGAITEYSTGLNAGTVPNAITVGPDGNVWFTDRGATPAIGRITTGGTITEYSSGLPTGSSPDGIATGPDGSLWFADKGAGGAIGTIDPTSHAIVEYKTGLLAGSVPTKLAVGADGNLWVVDTGTTKAVDRIGAGAAAASITPPSVIGSDGVLVPQSCAGDVWSTWVGQQPSHTAFGFDGYQWLLDGSAIAGATGPSYTPTLDDAGHQLSCEATVTYSIMPTTASATSAGVEVKDANEQLADLAAAVTGVGPEGSLDAKICQISADGGAGCMRSARRLRERGERADRQEDQRVGGESRSWRRLTTSRSRSVAEYELAPANAPERLVAAELSAPQRTLEPGKTVIADKGFGRGRARAARRLVRSETDRPRPQEREASIRLTGRHPPMDRVLLRHPQRPALARTPRRPHPQRPDQPHRKTPTRPHRRDPPQLANRQPRPPPHRIRPLNSESIV